MALFFGTFAPKYRYRPWGTTFSGELNTKREVKAEVKVDDVAGVVGLATTVTVQETTAVKATDSNQLFATVGLEYHHENATATASVDFGKTEGSTIKASAVAGTQGALVGGQAQYHTGTQELQNLNLFVGYRTVEYDVGLVLSNTDGRQLNEVAVKYYHSVNPELSVGAELVADVQNTTKTPKLQFATRWNPDRDTSVKTKFDTDGKLGLSLGQKVSKNVKYTVSTTIDANNLGAKQASQFGFTLNLTY